MTTLSGAGTFNENLNDFHISNATTLILAPNQPFNVARDFTIDGGSTFSFSTPFTIIGRTGANNFLNINNNNGTINGNGANLLTQNNVRINNGSFINIPLVEIVSGILRTGGTFAGLQIDLNTRLELTTTLNAAGNVTNNGAIVSTDGAPHLFSIQGANFVNNGTVEQVNLQFQRGAAGTTVISGSGVIQSNISDTRISNGTTVRLGSNVNLYFLNIDGGSTFNFNNFTLFLASGGTPVTNNGTAITNARIVYNGTTGQTVQTNNIDYALLGIDNPSSLTLSAPETVSQQLRLIRGTFNNSTNLTLADGIQIVRDSAGLAQSPNFAGAVNLEYIGNTNQTFGFEIPPNGTLNNLTLNKSAGTTMSDSTIVMNRAITVNGALTFTGGFLSSPTDVLTVGVNGTATGNENGFYIGSLRKIYDHVQQFTFPVGTADGYSRVEAATTAVGQANSTLTVRAIQSIQPNVSAGDQPRALRRYWTLTETGDLTVSPQFYYRQADVPAGINESIFELRRYNGAVFATIPAAIFPTDNFAATLGGQTEFADFTLVAPPDTDGDGVPDSRDSCANTPNGATVNQFGCAANQAVNAPAGQVLWAAGEGDARDISGNGNDGTLAGNAAFTIGKVGQSFNFANGGSATFGSASVPTGDAPRTVEMWIKTDSASWDANYRTFYHQGSDNNSQAFALAASGNGSTRTIIIDGWFNDVTVDVTAETTANGWQHIAAIYSGGGNVRLVVNGVDKGAVSFPNGALNTSNANILLNSGGLSQFLNQPIDEVSVYNRALSVSETQAIYAAGANGKLKQAAFNAQTSVKIAAATVNFPAAQTGTANEQGLDGAGLPPITNGTPKLYYDISTTAPSANAGVCFNVASLAGSFANLKVYHLENNIWVDRTAVSNTSPNLCTTALPSFSPFAIVQLAPTAAEVSVGGRAVTKSGRGINNLTVRLINADGTMRTVRTTTFGYFKFEKVTAGQTVVVQVLGKNYNFSSSSQIVNLTDSSGDLLFVADK